MPASEQFCLFFCFQQNMQKWFEIFWFCSISVLFFVHLRVCLFVYLLLSLFSKKMEHPAVVVVVGSLFDASFTDLRWTLAAPSSSTSVSSERSNAEKRHTNKQANKQGLCHKRSSRWAVYHPTRVSGGSHTWVDHAAVCSGSLLAVLR